MEKRFMSDARTQVMTAAGIVRGYLYDDIYVFKGVPYARAQRFQKPEDTPPWEGVRDCTSYGYVSPLLNQERPVGELLVPHRYWLMDEHCQNLNVWTPGTDGAKRPVLVWLHGGGYSAGSAIEQVAYEGENMSRLGDVVVVSVNHRLNILGYLDLSPYGERYEDSGNAGGNDIIAALKWVRKNIAAFGGDPGNVTVFGQSGGGGKVVTLLQSPEADGLYHRGAVISGVLPDGLMGSVSNDSRPLVRALLAELNLTKEQVSELETLPYELLAKAYNRVAPRLKAAGEYVGCVPRPGKSYLGNPMNVDFREETADVPLMVGTVYGEFAFAPLIYDKRKMTRQDGAALITERYGREAAGRLLPLYEKAYPHRNPADLMVLDGMFRRYASEFIAKRAALGRGAVYSYLFDADFPVEGGKPAWHCADLAFFFHNTALVPSANIPGVTDRLEECMFGALIAFAKSGDPNHDGLPAWPRCDAREERTMLFNGSPHVRVNFDRELLDAFQEIAKKEEERARAEADIRH